MPQAQQNELERKHTRKQILLGLVAIFLIYTTAFYYMQTLVAARPKIAAELNGMPLYAWLISIPGLAGAFATLIFLKFSDMYGRRLMLLVSLSIFMVGTVLSATRSGQILTPFGVLMAFVGVPTGFLIARTKRYKRMFVMSYALLTVVMAGCTLFNETTPMVWGLAATTLGGLGLGAVPTIKTVVVQCVVPKRLLGIATGAYFFSVTMAMSISPAVLGSVMNIAYMDKLKTSLPAGLNGTVDDATMNSLGNSRVLLSKPAMQALERTFGETGTDGQARFRQTVQGIRASMEFGLRMVFLVGAGTMFLAFLLVLFIPEVSIDVEVKDKRIP